jgi:hypothetical protein
VIRTVGVAEPAALTIDASRAARSAATSPKAGGIPMKTEWAGWSRPASGGTSSVLAGRGARVPTGRNK